MIWGSHFCTGIILNVAPQNKSPNMSNVNNMKFLSIYRFMTTFGKWKKSWERWERRPKLTRITCYRFFNFPNVYFFPLVFLLNFYHIFIVFALLLTFSWNLLFQYKEIAQTNDAALKQIESVHEEYKSEVWRHYNFAYGCCAQL